MVNRSHETWDHLLVLLGKMQEVFHEFLSLLGEEERLLLGMDRQGIEDITVKKEQVLEGMRRYEQLVMAMLQRLAGEENREQLGRWLKKSPQPQALAAKTIFHELVGLAKNIQEQGKKNEAVVRRTQHVVREAVNLIYTGLGTGPVYQGSGALQFSSVPSSVPISRDRRGMAGISHIFNIARSGIQAHQQGLTTTSHNITNINTQRFFSPRSHFRKCSPCRRSHWQWSASWAGPSDC